MGKVVDFTGITRLDLPVERILDKAKEKLKSVIVIGWDKDGYEYFASSIADGGDILWLLERFKIALMSENGD